MKKQILGAIISISMLSTAPLLANSSSDDDDAPRLTKKKSQASALKKGSSKNKSSSHHKSKQDSKDSVKKSVRPHKSNSKGKKTDKGAASIIMPLSANEDSPTYSITTTDSPSDATTTPSNEEILAPRPKSVKKNTKKRVPKHGAVFNKQTGHKSAATYLEENSVDMDAPQIGHAHSYKNHGPAADTRKDNLAVISQTTNLKMNIVDGKYKDGDVDANRFITEEETKIVKHTIQQLANPSNPTLPITPAIVMEADMEKLSKEENEEFKKKINRAMSPERKKEIARAQAKNPDNFSTLEENDKKVQKKVKEYKNEGKSGPYVIKFSDHSRSNRSKDDETDKNKKGKK